MADRSIPQVGTRIDLMVFAQDVLAHQGLVQVEPYASLDFQAVVVSDGAGARVALVGDRSSLRMVLEAALDQLADDESEGGRRPDTYLDGTDHDTGQGG